MLLSRGFLYPGDSLNRLLQILPRPLNIQPGGIERSMARDVRQSMERDRFFHPIAKAVTQIMWAHIGQFLHKSIVAGIKHLCNSGSRRKLLGYHEKCMCPTTVLASSFWSLRQSSFLRTSGLNSIFTASKSFIQRLRSLLREEPHEESGVRGGRINLAWTP